jgi:HAD superfamily hydrolase (TIGR01490 family)
VEQEVAQSFYRDGTLPLAHLVRVGAIYAQYNLGLLRSFDQLKARGAVAFTDRLVERDTEAYASLFERHLWPAVYPEAKTAIAHWRAHGAGVFIVSSTYAFMIEPFARKLGVDAFWGVQPEVAAGRFTGKLAARVPHQEHKAEIVRAIAAERGLDLGLCAAYGDSTNDLAMLAAVGRPHVVNPARGLLREARTRGWPVLRWGGAP